MNNIWSDNKSGKWKHLSPEQLIVTFPTVILQENTIEQSLLEESIVYRKAWSSECVNL